MAAGRALAFGSFPTKALQAGDIGRPVAAGAEAAAVVGLRFGHHQALGPQPPQRPGHRVVVQRQVAGQRPDARLDDGRVVGRRDQLFEDEPGHRAEAAP